MTRQRWIIAGVVVFTLIAGAVWFLRGNEATANTPYRLAAIERGDVEETISSTGTVTALQTVAIGTQVSGQVIELNADFNDRVQAGQLLARIDPTLQRQQVRNAEANLERVQADLRRTEQEYQRSLALYEQNVITETEFSQAEYSLTVARSSATSAEINLEQARQNLAYTEIYAPIDGVVIERNAEVGQTVAASLSTPQLFLLANDLSELEIHANVDESEIGMIEAGQEVRFTVQAYRGETFRGTVRQVRLQSTSQENVVNYRVIIAVDNPDLRLLPGMTATVDFIVRRAEDVFKVANAALRFNPTPEMLAELGEDAIAAAGRGMRPGAGNAAGPVPDSAQRAQMAAQRRERATSGETPAQRTTPSAGAASPNGFPGGARMSGGAAPVRMNFANLWYLKDGALAVMQVRSGVSDGVQTEIQGPDIEEGLQVIAGLNVATPTTGTATTNPFQQGGNRGGPPGGMRFGPGGF
jgi:HlyD family secretion protein